MILFHNSMIPEGPWGQSAAPTVCLPWQEFSLSLGSSDLGNVLCCHGSSYPHPPPGSPVSWMENFQSMLMKKLGRLWFVADTHTPAWPSLSREKAASPPPAPLLRDNPMLLGCPCWIWSFPDALLRGCWSHIQLLQPPLSLPTHIALPVIPVTFLESFLFSITTFSHQLVNKLIIQGAHIKADLSWYSSFHMLLSLHVPQSSDFPSSTLQSLLFLEHLTQSLCLCSAQ